MASFDSDAFFTDAFDEDAFDFSAAPPPTPPSFFTQAPGGVWTITQFGHFWMVETQRGTMKVIDLDPVLTQARNVGASIKWIR